MGCQNNEYASYCQFCNYWQCQKCCLMTLSYLFTYQNEQDYIWEDYKKAGKKSVQQPCRFRGGFTRDLGAIAEIAAVRIYNIPRSNLQFKVTSKYSKSSMGPVLILSEDEEQVVVKWMTVSRKNILGGIWVSSCLLKNF